MNGQKTQENWDEALPLMKSLITCYQDRDNPGLVAYGNWERFHRQVLNVWDDFSWTLGGMRQRLQSEGHAKKTAQAPATDKVDATPTKNTVKEDRAFMVEIKKQTKAMEQISFYMGIVAKYFEDQEVIEIEETEPDTVT